MKNFFLILLGIIVIFSSFSQAEVKQFTAQSSYIIENNETLERARSRALQMALADISRQAAAAIKGYYVSEDNKLTEDILIMATSSIIKVTEQKFDMKMTSDNKPEVFVNVTANVDIDAAKKKSAELMLKNDNTPPNKGNSAENSPAPANWWENDILTAQGFGDAPSYVTNPGQKKYLARQMAFADGLRNLAAQAAGVHITAHQSMIKMEIDAVISGVKIVSESYDELGSCTVVLQVPVYGVHSIAQTVFKPVDKKDFPAPSTENNFVAGNYTGLIIDCGDMELNPVLLPTIQNSNDQTIYGYENLDYEKVVESGMIGYMEKNSTSPSAKNNLMLLNFISLKTAEAAEYSARAGDNPLVVKATALSENNTCPVVSSDDADKILAENQASHFLNNGKVVFTSNKVRAGRF